MKTVRILETQSILAGRRGLVFIEESSPRHVNQRKKKIPQSTNVETANPNKFFYTKKENL